MSLGCIAAERHSRARASGEQARFLGGNGMFGRSSGLLWEISELVPRAMALALALAVAYIAVL